MSSIVIGVAHNDDTSAVKAALTSAGLPLERLTVICEADAAADTADSGVRYISTGRDSFATLSGGGAILTSSGGGGVPGLGATAALDHEFFRNESIAELLGDLELSEAQLDAYLSAVERGGAVIAYHAEPELQPRVREALSSAGVGNVQAL